MEIVTGVLASLKVYNGRWGLAFITLEDGDEVRCVGTPLVGLKKGKTYQFNGSTKDHEKYGTQFDVSHVDGVVAGSVATKPRKKSVKSVASSKPRKYSSGSTAPRRSKPHWGRKNSRGRVNYVGPYVDKHSADSPRPSLQLDRIALSAYEFGSVYSRDHESVDKNELTKAIHCHLCETIAWKLLGDVCLEQAAKAATQIIGHYIKLANPLGQPKSEQEAVIILVYESAHHIGLDIRSVEKTITRAAFIKRVYRDIKTNYAATTKTIDAAILKAAATHAANELLGNVAEKIK